MACPAAPHLEKRFPDSGSIYAEEGTLAHSLCEAKLRYQLGEEVTDELTQIRADTLYTKEMEDATDDYVDIVWTRFTGAKKQCPDAQLLLETKLDLSAYIPEGFGTADALIIADDTMEVVDFKYGKGVAVDAEENPQMMIYALGALEAFDTLYNIATVRVTIVQPRIHHTNSWTTTEAVLREWGGKHLRPAARTAYEDKGTPTPGDHCRFCRAKSACRTLSDEAIEQARATDSRLLSLEELAERLPTFDRAESHFSAAREYALSMALSGHRVPGYKVVEGRSVRRLTDETELANRAIEAGYNEAVLYKPRQLETLSALEKIIGKKQFATLADGLLEKPQGKPTLVPESDKRPVFDPNPTDDFTAD